MLPRLIYIVDGSRHRLPSRESSFLCLRDSTELWCTWEGLSRGGIMDFLRVYDAVRSWMILRVEMRLAALRANRYSHMDIACMQNGGEGCWSAQPWVEHADDASYTLSMNPNRVVTLSSTWVSSGSFEGGLGVGRLKVGVA